MLGHNKLNCFEAMQVLGGLPQILIWRSEIAKGGTWSFSIKGGPKILGVPMNPKDAMIYIYIIYIYIYIHTYIWDFNISWIYKHRD